jgi:hypothetical protein
MSRSFGPYFDGVAARFVDVAYPKYERVRSTECFVDILDILHKALGAQNDIVASLQPSNNEVSQENGSSDPSQFTRTDNWATTFNRLCTTNTYPTAEDMLRTIGIL